MELCVIHNTLFRYSMLRAITVPPGETVGRLSFGAKNRPLFESDLSHLRENFLFRSALVSRLSGMGLV
jgi:hypothetical protein